MGATGSAAGSQTGDLCSVAQCRAETDWQSVTDDSQSDSDMRLTTADRAAGVSVSTELHAISIPQQTANGERKRPGQGATSETQR